MSVNSPTYKTSNPSPKRSRLPNSMPDTRAPRGSRTPAIPANTNAMPRPGYRPPRSLTRGLPRGALALLLQTLGELGPDPVTGPQPVATPRSVDPSGYFSDGKYYSDGFHLQDFAPDGEFRQPTGFGWGSPTHSDVTPVTNAEIEVYNDVIPTPPNWRFMPGYIIPPGVTEVPVELVPEGVTVYPDGTVEAEPIAPPRAARRPNSGLPGRRPDLVIDIQPNGHTRMRTRYTRGGRPPRGTREVKTQTAPGMNLVIDLLTIGSETVEVLDIMVDAAGLEYRDYRGLFLEGGIWEMDALTLSRGLALNVIEDRLLGHVFRANNRAAQKLGITTRQY